MPQPSHAAVPADVDRTQLQRQRILDAARACFIESGFEAATMARIAARAGLSTGLPYHYFENKRAIMLALIETQLERVRELMGRAPADLDLARVMGDGYGRWREREHNDLHIGLLCEITALGTRDEAVGDRLLANSRDARELLAGWLVARDEALGRQRSARDAERAALLIQCVGDGLSMLAAREPGLDRALIGEMLDRVLPLALD